MSVPPPMPDAMGFTKPWHRHVATAASIAFPPARMTFTPCSPHRSWSEATAAPPTALSTLDAVRSAIAGWPSPPPPTPPGAQPAPVDYGGLGTTLASVQKALAATAGPGAPACGSIADSPETLTAAVRAALGKQER